MSAETPLPTGPSTKTPSPAADARHIIPDAPATYPGGARAFGPGQSPLFSHGLTNVDKASERRAVDTFAGGETTEKELDALIRRRHDHRVKNEGERAELEAWQLTERLELTRKREENRWEWVRYFDRIATSLRARAEEYDRRAEKLATESGHHGEESK